MEIKFQPIGILHTPHKNAQGMPIQTAGAISIKGEIEIYPEFAEGLKDLDGFSHIILLYHFHLSEGFNLLVIPFLDTEVRGVFSTRAPRRPNSIGMSIVKLIEVKNNILYIENVDMLDGTPLLDIKPFIPATDVIEEVKTGWLEKKTETFKNKLSDERFK